MGPAHEWLIVEPPASCVHVSRNYISPNLYLLADTEINTITDTSELSEPEISGKAKLVEDGWQYALQFTSSVDVCPISKHIWFASCHYSENARVCAKWQWNARDCVTGLLDRRSRECNPVTPVECVSLSFRTHTCVLAFITYIMCTNGIEMALV